MSVMPQQQEIYEHMYFCDTFWKRSAYTVNICPCCEAKHLITEFLQQFAHTKSAAKNTETDECTTSESDAMKIDTTANKK